MKNEHQQNNEEDVQRLQKEIDTYRRDLQDCRGNLRSLQTAVKKTIHQDSSIARKDLAAARQELEPCKDALFCLQPVFQIPDSQILKSLETLNLQVVSWIDEEIFAFEKVHPESEADLIFSISTDEDAASIVRKYPGAGEHLARAMIHHYLQDHIFAPHVYLLGLPDETRMMLQRAEDAMTRLDPPRGKYIVACEDAYLLITRRC